MTREHSDLPKSFASIATASGIALIVFALSHFIKMRTWVDADEFGGLQTGELPDERRSIVMAGAAAAIGVISFVALIVTQ